ncbi:MAG: glyoxalase [Betaproteobacteria bacterium]|nr:glyoxalase [Betaproteobacteria bacterium]
MAVRKLGHVGIFAQDFEKLRDFYSQTIGLTITDETPSAAFMSSNPEQEHHELLVAKAADASQRTQVQQLSFSCQNLSDIIGFYQKFKAQGVKVSRAVSHGNAVGLYFYDPEGNHCELYWTTPFKARQPYGVAVDLTQPEAEILRGIEADVKIHGATGHRDPESFVRQREQFVRDGMRV